MAVVAVTQLETEASEADDGTISYTSTYRVRTDSRSDGARTALAAGTLPKRGDYYSFGTDIDTTASCRTRSIKHEGVQDTAKTWLVTLNYSTKGSSQDPGDNQNGEPIDWGWKCNLDTWTRMVAPETDRNGRALVNVNDEPFLPPPENEESDPLVILEKNHPSISLSAWSESQGKVNSVAMWGLQSTRMLKLRKWIANPHWVGPGQMYWKFRFEVEVKFDRYFFQPPNLGFHERVGVDPLTGKPKTRQIKDEFWMPAARPVALDAGGEQLPLGQVALFFDQAAGPLQRFELEDEYDLSTILPATLPGNFT